MATHKINRKKNITQRKKYKKIGNKLLNTQKRIRKQSKNKRQLKKPVKKKQTFKIIKCPKCKGVKELKELKISKKKIDRLRNAGLLTDDIYKALSVIFCCGDIFDTSSMEDINEFTLNNGRESRIQNIINLRNRSLSSSSALSNNSSSYRTANVGSSPTPIKEEPYYILVKDSHNTQKNKFEKDAEYISEYNKKILAEKCEGSLQL